MEQKNNEYRYGSERLNESGIRERFGGNSLDDAYNELRSSTLESNSGEMKKGSQVQMEIDALLANIEDVIKELAALEEVIAPVLRREDVPEKNESKADVRPSMVPLAEKLNVCNMRLAIVQNGLDYFINHIEL